MQNLDEIVKKINIEGPVLFDEPMIRHTSFKIGGPADVLIVPNNLDELSRLFGLLLEENIPYFILGAGANILVSDRGIRGVVIDLSAIKGCYFDRERGILSAYAGTEVNDACDEALRLNLAGIEFLYSMPGSIGGSIWMNARCYGSSISEILEWVEILDDSCKLKRLPVDKRDFGYKTSPFQKKKVIIYRGGFRLYQGKREEIQEKREQYRQDREKKGHFLYPSAGSIFKNNRSFGNPTGKIIDTLGLGGYGIGGALVSDLHANIIINTGKARADEVLELIRLIEEKVYQHLGFKLEREILLIGEW